jgi:hypothetical protein
MYLRYVKHMLIFDNSIVYKKKFEKIFPLEEFNFATAMVRIKLHVEYGKKLH